MLLLFLTFSLGDDRNFAFFYGSYSTLILLTELPLNCSVSGPSRRGSALVTLLALQEPVMLKKTGEKPLLLIITAWANAISMLLKHGNHHLRYLLLSQTQLQKVWSFSSFASPSNTLFFVLLFAEIITIPRLLQRE